MNEIKKEQPAEQTPKLQLKKQDVRALRVRVGVRTGVGSAQCDGSNDCTNPTLRTK